MCLYDVLHKRSELKSVFFVLAVTKNHLSFYELRESTGVVSSVFILMQVLKTQLEKSIKD